MRRTSTSSTGNQRTHTESNRILGEMKLETTSGSTGLKKINISFILCLTGAAFT